MEEKLYSSNQARSVMSHDKHFAAAMSVKCMQLIQIWTLSKLNWIYYYQWPCESDLCDFMLDLRVPKDEFGKQNVKLGKHYAAFIRTHQHSTGSSHRCRVFMAKLSPKKNMNESAPTVCKWKSSMEDSFHFDEMFNSTRTVVKLQLYHHYYFEA